MKKKFIPFVISVIFICITTLTFAQVPGYQGKRFSLNLNLNTFVALLNPTYVSNLSTTTSSYPSSYINTRWSGDIDYVVSRSGSIGFTLQYLRTGNNATAETQFGDPIDGYYTESVITFVDIKTTGVGAYYKFFFYRKHGSIAPLGMYGRLDAIAFLSSATQAIEGGEYSNIPSSIKDYGHVATNLGITYTIGSQSVYFNHLIANFGFEFGVIPSYLPHIGSSTPAYNADPTVELGDAARNRLATHILMNLNVGLGYLIF